MDSLGKVSPARSTDPSTSHRAAMSASLRAGTQKHKLLKVFARANVPLIDEEAADLAGLNTGRCCWWKRCGELREAGYIAWAYVAGENYEKKSSANHWCQTSMITPKGRDKLRELET